MYQILSNNLGKHLRLVFAVFFFFAQVFSEALPVFAGIPRVISDFSISETEGWVNTVYHGSQPGHVFIIKDAHAVPQAQKSISQILSKLEHEQNVEWIGAEGAAGVFGTEFFHAFPDQAQLREILLPWIERGELGGAAIAALSSNSTGTVYEGLENTELYQKGVSAFRKAGDERREFLSFWLPMNLRTENAAQKIYSPTGLEWARKTQSIHDSGASPSDWMRVLVLMRRHIPFFKKKYPNLQVLWTELRISRVQSMYGTTAIERLKESAEKKYPQLKKQVSWHALNQDGIAGRLSLSEYASQFYTILLTEGEAHFSENFLALARLGQHLRALRSGAWIQEWESALSEAEKLIFKSDEQKQIRGLSLFLDCLRRGFLLQWTRSDWEAYQLMKDSLSFSYGLENSGFQAMSLARYFESSAAFQFYLNAVAREEAFHQKLTKFFERNRQGRAAIVVGGFHASAAESFLRSRGQSYTVIMPFAGGLPDENAYESMMRDEVSWKEHFQIQHGRIHAQESFAAACLHRLLDLKTQKENPRRVLSHYQTWRENLIRGAIAAKAPDSFLAALNFLDQTVLNHLYFQSQKIPQMTKGENLTPRFGRAIFNAAGIAIQPWTAVPLGSLQPAVIAPSFEHDPEEVDGGGEELYDEFGMLKTRSRISPANYHAPLTQNELAQSLYFSRFHGPIETLSKILKELSDPHAFRRFRKDVEDLASWDVRVLARFFGPDDRKTVMAFILMTAPDLFEKTKSWHHDFFSKLDRLRQSQPEFFDGQLPVVLDSSMSLILARKSARQNHHALVMAFSFSEQVYTDYIGTGFMQRIHAVGYDGKARAFVQGGLGKLIQPEVTYAIQDGIYPDLHYGHRRDLFLPNGWEIRVPFYNPQNHEEGWDRVQALVLRPTEEAPRGSLSAYLNRATGIPFLTHEDGSYSAQLKDLEQLATVHDAALEYGYIVTMDHALSKDNFHVPPPQIQVRLYPREVRGDHLSLREKMDLLFERQVRTGQLVREEGKLKWVPFMRIIEDGETVYYALYKNGQATVYSGAVPPDVQEQADFIFILNADRAKRPGASASSPTSWPSDEPGQAPDRTVEVAPAFIEGQIPDEMFFYVTGPSGQRWMFAPNRFPILPPWLSRAQSEQPQASVITHEVHSGQFSYPQNRMHDEANIVDLLTIHAQFEGLEFNLQSTAALGKAVSSAMQRIFKDKIPDAYNLLITGKVRVVAVNGYHPPNAPVEAHGGASQLQGHAQLLKFRLPLQNLPESAFKEIGDFQAEGETVKVFVMNAGGQTALVFERKGQRAFVFSRPNGKPEGFTGFWSFMELGRAIVIDDVARFFQLEPDEREDLQRSNPAAWLRAHAEKLQQRGVHPDLLVDAVKAFSRSRKSVTAAPGRMEKLGFEIIEQMNGTRRSETRIPEADLLRATARAAEELRQIYPQDYVPEVIVEGNRAAALEPLARSEFRDWIRRMDTLAQAHFTKSKAALHLGFVMAYDPEAKEELLLLAAKIDELKKHYPDQIQNHLTVLILESQKNELELVIKELHRLGARVLTSGLEAVSVLPLLGEGHVFAYGLQGTELLPEGLRHLVVDSHYPMHRIFSAALILNLSTASESKLTAERVMRVPNELDNLFEFNLQSRRLGFLSGVLESAWLESAARKLFGASA